MGADIEVRTRAKQREIGLQLRHLIGKCDWILDADDGPACQPRDEQVGEPVHGAGVAGTRRLAYDDRAADQLDPRIVREDPGLAHSMIFLEGEAATLDVNTHGAIQAERYRRVNALVPTHPKVEAVRHVLQPGTAGAPIPRPREGRRR